MSAMVIARVRPVWSAAMRMMAGRGRPGIPYYECHGDGEGETGEERPMRMMAGRGRPGISYYERDGDREGETGEERRHEDDGGEGEARNTLL